MSPGVQPLFISFLSLLLSLHINSHQFSAGITLYSLEEFLPSCSPFPPLLSCLSLVTFFLPWLVGVGVSMNPSFSLTKNLRWRRLESLFYFLLSEPSVSCGFDFCFLVVFFFPALDWSLKLPVWRVNGCKKKSGLWHFKFFFLTMEVFWVLFHIRVDL